MERLNEKVIIGRRGKHCYVQKVFAENSAACDALNSLWYLLVDFDVRDLI
jgi:hypothetical protein